MTPQEIGKLVECALESSVYIAPLEFGLTHEELHEVCRAFQLQTGEINDALQKSTRFMGSSPRVLPDPNIMLFWSNHAISQEPEYRNLAADDFLFLQFNNSLRSAGAANARLERCVIVERAIREGIRESDIEGSISIALLSNKLHEKNGFLRVQYNSPQPLPSEIRSQSKFRRPHNDVRARVFQITKDIIERRTDGRPKSVEPLDAFADELSKLGYGQFRLWWKQLVAELRHSDVQTSPVSVAILSAALVEGSLTFVVKHARDLGLGVFGSKDFEGNPRTWKIDHLVSGATAGRGEAILDTLTRDRATELIRIRQRIHAGRMLHEYSGGVSDLRPEEARVARETAELIVRRVLDWLYKNPSI